MNNSPIGVFDSGVGGLSIFKALKILLSKESFIFVADQRNIPYGGKTKKQLVQFSTRIADFLINQKKVKAIVVACNTSTIYSIKALRSSFKVPIIGTVPVIKTIATISKSKKTAVFSTPATAKSVYLTKLIKKFADGVEVYKIGGTGLEDLIEAGNLKSSKIKKILAKFLIPLKEKGVDALALGCTHYPFLRDQIEAIMGTGVTVVDSGEAVARRTKDVLVKEKILGNGRTEDFFYTTGGARKFRKAIKNLLDLDTEKVYNLRL